MQKEEEPVDEVTSLKREIASLKKKVTDYEDREVIPFDGIEEEKAMKEVVIQTAVEASQPGTEKNYWEQMAEKVAKEHEENEAEKEREDSPNVFANLLGNFMGG